MYQPAMLAVQATAGAKLRPVPDAFNLYSDSARAPLQRFAWPTFALGASAAGDIAEGMHSIPDRLKMAMP